MWLLSALELYNTFQHNVLYYIEYKDYDIQQYLEAQLHHKQQLPGITKATQFKTTHWVPFTINRLTGTISVVIHHLFLRQQTIQICISHKWVIGLQKAK